MSESARRMKGEQDDAQGLGGLIEALLVWARATRNTRYKRIELL